MNNNQCMEWMSHTKAYHGLSLDCQQPKDVSRISLVQNNDQQRREELCVFTEKGCERGLCAILSTQKLKREILLKYILIHYALWECIVTWCMTTMRSEQQKISVHGS